MMATQETAQPATRRRERLDRGIKARSEDIYALNSWREALYLLAPRACPVLALLALHLLLPYGFAV